MEFRWICKAMVVAVLLFCTILDAQAAQAASHLRFKGYDRAHFTVEAVSNREYDLTPTHNKCSIFQLIHKKPDGTETALSSNGGQRSYQYAIPATGSQDFRLTDLAPGEHTIFTRETYWIYNPDIQALEEHHAEVGLFTFTTSLDAPHIEGFPLWDEEYSYSANATLGDLTLDSERTLSFDGGGLDYGSVTVRINGTFNYSNGEGVYFKADEGTGSISMDGTRGSLISSGPTINLTTCDLAAVSITSDDLQIIDSLVNGVANISGKAYSITDSEFHGNTFITTGNGNSSFTGNTVYRNIEFRNIGGGNPTVSDCTFFRAVTIPSGQDYSSTPIVLSNCNFGMINPTDSGGNEWLNEEFGAVVDMVNFSVPSIKSSSTLKPSSISSDRPLPGISYSHTSGQGTLPSIPMQGRDTLVAIRLWAPTTGSISSGNYALEFNGETLQPENSGYTFSMDTKVTKDPGNANLSLNFIVPARLSNVESVDWQLTFTPNSPSGYLNGTEQIFSGTTQFQKKYARKFSVGIVPVNFDLFMASHKAETETVLFNDSVKQLKTKLAACWPIAQDQLVITELPPFRYRSYASGQHWFSRIYDLTLSLQIFLRTYNLTAPVKIDKLVAVLPRNSIGGEQGVNWKGNDVSLVDSLYTNSTLHELGHAFNLYISTEQYDMDTGWYNGEYLIKKDGISLQGVTLFNPEGTSVTPVKQRIRHLPHNNLNGVYDIFGNIDPTWTALSTRGLLENSLLALLGREGASPRSSDQQRQVVAAGHKRILMRGILGPEEGKLVLDPRSVTSMDTSDTLDEEVRDSNILPYTFRAYDSSGTELMAQRCYNDTSDNDTIQGWLQSFDIPDSTAKVELFDINTGKIVWQTTTGTAPDVTLTMPSDTAISDSVKVSWSDATTDGSTRYQLLVRESGNADWQPLTDFTDATEQTIHPSALPRSNSLEFALLASNGLGKSLVTSSGFERTNQPPEVEILLPQPDDTADPSHEWTLAASGFDPDGDAMTWQWESNIDGVLGNQPTLANVTLSAGQHTLNCTATDSEGAATAVQVTVTAGAVTAIDLSIPEDAMNVTVGGSDPLLQGGNQFKPGAESTVTLSVRNLGLANEGRLVCTVTPPGGIAETIIDKTFEWDEFETYAASAKYTPTDAGDYEVSATLTTNATDPDGTNNTRTWTLGNDAPVPNDMVLQVREGQSRAITLSASDPDSDSLTYTVVQQPAIGLLSGTAPNLTYTAPAGRTGIDSFTYRVSDGLAQSDPVIVQVDLVSASLVHTVAVNTNGAGNASPAGTVAVSSGDSLSITMTPDNGYEVDRVFVNQVLQGSTASPLVIDTIQGNLTVEIYFKKSIVDTDSDGLEDSWETTYFGNLNQTGSQDYDGDGLTNFQEYVSVSALDPTKTDTDNDGMPDKWENDNMLFGDWASAQQDQDNDGATDLEEYLGGSDPWDPNSLPAPATNVPTSAINLLLLH